MASFFPRPMLLGKTVHIPDTRDSRLHRTQRNGAGGGAASLIFHMHHRFVRRGQSRAESPFHRPSPLFNNELSRSLLHHNRWKGILSLCRRMPLHKKPASTNTRHHQSATANKERCTQKFVPRTSGERMVIHIFRNTRVRMLISCGRVHAGGIHLLKPCVTIPLDIDLAAVRSRSTIVNLERKFHADSFLRQIYIRD